MSRIGVVTALRAESRAVLAALARPRRVRAAARPTWTAAAGTQTVMLVQGGVGPEPIRRVLPLLETVDVLLSVGFAGALAPELRPGDLVLATAISWEDDDGRIVRYPVAAGLHAAVARALVGERDRGAVAGSLFSSPVIVASTAAKRAAAARHDAIAVEMEAAALAAYASARDVPLLAIRAILDPAELSLEGLPPGLDTSWAARARLLTMPAVWPLVATLRQSVAVACDALTRALRVALPALG